MKPTGKIPVDALNDVLLDGDIILFQGNNVGSCLQRCILNAPTTMSLWSSKPATH